MLKLNKDCLIIIFEELKDEPKALYSCLLVNKSWCEIVTPILWRFPWKFFDKEHLIYNIILQSLSEETKNILSNQGLDIIFKKQQRQQRQQKPLLYDYISFCKYIKHNYIFNEYFYQDFNIIESQKILLEQEIYKLFINKCSAIKYLSMIGIKYPLYKFPGAKKCFSALNELQCETNIESTFFYELSKICKTIENFYVILQDDNPGFIKLIQAQRKIKNLIIWVDDDENEDEDYLKNNNNNKHEKFGEEITIKHADFIEYFFLIINFTFPFYTFTKLINLETLTLSNDYGVREDLFSEQLEISKFPKLQTLNLYDLSLSIAIKIIKNTKGNLKNVQIQSIVVDGYTRRFIKTIYQYCPNIKYVTVFLNSENLDDFVQLLIRCRQLEGIEIKDDFTIDKEYFNCKELLNFLSMFAPINLYKIHIDLKVFTLESLSLFFNNWKGRKPLCLTYREYKDIRDDKLYRLICKYKKEGVISEIRKAFWDENNENCFCNIDSGFY